MNAPPPELDAALHLRHSRRYAVLLLLALLAHTYVKWRLGTLPELLWGCNVASFCILAGLWLQSPRAVAVGFLWHVCIGDPAYLAEVIRSGHTGWSSVLVHSLPAVAGFFYLRRTGLPRGAPYLALAMFIALVPLSHYLTPTPLNINLAHQRLGFVTAWFPGNWSYRVAFSAGMLLVLLVGDALLALILKRPPAAGPSQSS